MAIETQCQTNDAIFITGIHDNKIEVEVYLGKSLNLSKKQAKLLERNIHNALELVLAPYFMEEYYAHR